MILCVGDYGKESMLWHKGDGLCMTFSRMEVYGVIGSCISEAWKVLASWIGLAQKPTIDRPWEVASLNVLFDRDGVGDSYETLGGVKMVGDMEATCKTISWWEDEILLEMGRLLY